MLLLFLKAALGVLVLTTASFATGAWLTRRLSAAFTALDRIGIGLLGGFGLLSLFLFIVGQFSFHLWTILLVIAAATIGGARFLPQQLKDILGAARSLRDAPKPPLVIVTAVLLLTAIAGLAEVTGDWRSDTVEYHLLGPKVWVRQGVIRPVPDNCHTAFPQVGETMFAALLAIGGSRAPGFSSFVTFAMLLLMAAALARRSRLDSAGAWWVAAIVATMPAVYTGSINCFVDGIYAALVLAAIRTGMDAQTFLDWTVFGVFCGLAMGTKYTGILAFVVVLPCILFMRTRFKPPALRRQWQAIGVAISVAGVVAAPYYLRDWILLGCPLYPPPPGLAHFCSPKYLSPQVVTAFHAYIRERGAGLGRSIGAFLLLPFNLTYHTANFHGAGGIGLLPLALGPVGLVAARRDAAIRVMASIGVLLVAVWFVTQQESRFLIHVFVLAAIIAVVGWNNLRFAGRHAARALALLVVLTSIGYGLFMMAPGLATGVRMVLEPSFAAAMRNANIPYQASFQYINNSPEVKRILILDRSVMPYYSDKDYVKPMGWWGERTLAGALSPAQALQEVHHLNVSHVLDVNSEVSGFEIIGETPILTKVFEDKDQRVYRVN